MTKSEITVITMLGNFADGRCNRKTSIAIWVIECHNVRECLVDSLHESCWKKKITKCTKEMTKLFTLLGKSNDSRDRWMANIQRFVPKRLDSARDCIFDVLNESRWKINKSKHRGDDKILTLLRKITKGGYGRTANLRIFVLKRLDNAWHCVSCDCWNELLCNK